MPRPQGLVVIVSAGSTHTPSLEGTVGAVLATMRRPCWTTGAGDTDTDSDADYDTPLFEDDDHDSLLCEGDDTLSAARGL